MQIIAKHTPFDANDIPVSPLVSYAEKRAQREQKKVEDIALNGAGLLPSGANVDYDVATYIDTKDVAKMLRARLKAEFPGYKFKVRTERYSGGSSIYVSFGSDFEDAEDDNRRRLNAIVRDYGSKEFDGMIDYAYSITHWLHADGYTVSRAYSPGTLHTAGCDPEEDHPNPGGAKLVKLGAGYAFAQRGW